MCYHSRWIKITPWQVCIRTSLANQRRSTRARRWRWSNWLIVYVLYVQRTGHSAAQRRRIKSQFRPASGKQDTNEAHCENKSSARRRSTRQAPVAAAGEARWGSATLPRERCSSAAVLPSFITDKSACLPPPPPPQRWTIAPARRAETAVGRRRDAAAEDSSGTQNRPA